MRHLPVTTCWLFSLLTLTSMLALPVAQALPSLLTRQCRPRPVADPVTSLSAAIVPVTIKGSKQAGTAMQTPLALGSSSSIFEPSASDSSTMSDPSSSSDPSQTAPLFSPDSVPPQSTHSTLPVSPTTIASEPALPNLPPGNPTLQAPQPTGSIAVTPNQTSSTPTQSLVAATRSNVVVYWGTGSLAAISLASVCSSTSYDVVVLSFVPVWGGNTMTIETASCSGAVGEVDCSNMAPDISTCQAAGKKVLLSFGGGDGSYGLANDAAGQTLAQDIWSLFLGGSSQTKRPFGSVVKLDGIDLDIEKGTSTGYATLVNTLRSLMNSDTTKPYFITAAPQVAGLCSFRMLSTDHCVPGSFFSTVSIS